MIKRSSPIARPPTPSDTRLRLVAASTAWDTPTDATRFISRGSSWSPSRKPTTSSPSRSCAPSTTASSPSGSGARREIETWILESRSRNVWRSCSMAMRRMFSCMRSSPSARKERSCSSIRSVRSVIDKLRAMARSSPISAAWNPSRPERARTRWPPISSMGTLMDVKSPTPGSRIRCARSRAAASSALTGTRPRGKPTISTTASAVTTAATSASSASDAHSTAQSIAAGVSGLAATATRNSASCCVDQLLGGRVTAGLFIPSAEGEHHQRLVVEAADAPGPCYFAVRVKAGNRGALRVRANALHLLANPFVAEHTPARDAVERQEPKRRPSGKTRDRLGTGSIGSHQHRVPVALHDPGQSALGNLGDAADGAVLEIRLGDEAHLLTAAPAEAERVGEREAGEGCRVGAHVVWRLQALQVDVQRRSVVEGVNSVAVAL